MYQRPFYKKALFWGLLGFQLLLTAFTFSNYWHSGVDFDRFANIYADEDDTPYPYLCDLEGTIKRGASGLMVDMGGTEYTAEELAEAMAALAEIDEDVHLTLREKDVCTQQELDELIDLLTDEPSGDFYYLDVIYRDGSEYLPRELREDMEEDDDGEEEDESSPADFVPAKRPDASNAATPQVFVVGLEDGKPVLALGGEMYDLAAFAERAEAMATLNPDVRFKLCIDCRVPQSFITELTDILSDKGVKNVEVVVSCSPIKQES